MIRASELTFPTDEAIMAHYLNREIEMGRLFSSPFRKDTNPSCSFFYSRSGRLYLRDFGRGINFSAISVVMELFGLDYVGAMNKIDRDKRKITPKSKSNRGVDKEVMIDVVLCPNTLYDDYWKKLGISRKLLLKYRVSSAKSIYRNGNLYAKATTRSPIYVYTFPSGRIKIYRPKAAEKNKKWYGNSTQEDICGISQLNKTGSLLIITKSLKDVMVLRAIGYNAIAPNSENSDPAFLSVHLKDLQRRFRYLLLLYDNDEAGRNFSNKMFRRYGIPELFLRREKDISDFVAKYGLNKGRKEINRIIGKKYRNEELFIGFDSYLGDLPY